MTLQAVSSVARQVLAVLVSVYGVLSASVAQLHLPPAVSAVLTAFGPVILAIEHAVSVTPTAAANAPTPTTATKVVAATPPAPALPSFPAA
jgi:hypothetical protein